MSPLWDRKIFAQNPYTLTDLCRHVDLYGKAAEHQVQCPVGRQSVPDHPSAAIAVQSNRPFRELAAWARHNVDRFRGAGIPLQTFQDAVEDEALRIYRAICNNKRQTERRACYTAQSVAKWTWQNYRRRELVLRPTITADELRTRQGAAGTAPAAKRRASTEAAILEAAARLAKHSATVPTQSAIITATKKSERTVRRYWPLVVSLVTTVIAPANEPTPDKRSPLEKKQTAFTEQCEQDRENSTGDDCDAPAELSPSLEAMKTFRPDQPGDGTKPATPATRPPPLSPLGASAAPDCSGGRNHPARQLSPIAPTHPVPQTGTPRVVPA